MLGGVRATTEKGSGARRDGARVVRAGRSGAGFLRWCARAFVALAFVAPKAALACYCAQPELPSSIAEADVIFEGVAPREPVAIEADIGLGQYGDVWTRRYEFEVLRYYKADGAALDAVVALHTPLMAPACGRTYASDEVYLIYARQRPDGLLVDFGCSRTRRVARAEEDLELLGAGIEPELGEPDAFGAGGALEEVGGAGIVGGCAMSPTPSSGVGALAAALGLALARVRRRRRAL